MDTNQGMNANHFSMSENSEHARGPPTLPADYAFTEPNSYYDYEQQLSTDQNHHQSTDPYLDEYSQQSVDSIAAQNSHGSLKTRTGYEDSHQLAQSFAALNSNHSDESYAIHENSDQLAQNVIAGSSHPSAGMLNASEYRHVPPQNLAAVSRHQSPQTFSAQKRYPPPPQSFVTHNRNPSSQNFANESKYPSPQSFGAHNRLPPTQSFAHHNLHLNRQYPITQNLISHQNKQQSAQHLPTHQNRDHSAQSLPASNAHAVSSNARIIGEQCIEEKEPNVTKKRIASDSLTTQRDKRFKIIDTAAQTLQLSANEPHKLTNLAPQG